MYRLWRYVHHFAEEARTPLSHRRFLRFSAFLRLIARLRMDNAITLTANKAKLESNVRNHETMNNCKPTRSIPLSINWGQQFEYSGNGNSSSSTGFCSST